MKIVGAIFDKMKNLNFFFLCELSLILKVDLKRKKRARGICKGTLDIEFERDWSVGLGAKLDDGQKIKNYFSSFRVFSGKSRLCHIVGLRMYPQNLMKIVGTISEKIEILNFFLCELPLILRVDRKRKKRARGICKGTLDIEFE